MFKLIKILTIILISIQNLSYANELPYECKKALQDGKGNFIYASEDCKIAIKQQKDYQQKINNLEADEACEVAIDEIKHFDINGVFIEKSYDWVTQPYKSDYVNAAKKLGHDVKSCTKLLKSKSNHFEKKSLPVSTFIFDDKKDHSNESGSPENLKSVETVNIVQSSNDNLKDQLKYWKDLYEEELITKDEYDQKRKKILESTTPNILTKQSPNENYSTTENTDYIEDNNTEKIDLSYQTKNYLNQNLLDSMGFMSNDKKIREYCENTYQKFHEYVECYGQNVKKYRNYKRASNLYDIYIEYGRHLGWQTIIGAMPVSEARFKLAQKKDQLAEAHKTKQKAKWDNIYDSLERIEKLNEATAPKSNHSTCVINKSFSPMELGRVNCY
tara:strand:+ start:171 stop:1328 length:1158 start_codon:yes stop_codon:yes gene_type:complete